MSNKAQGLVWDLECPATINGITFKPSHKFVLIAYADHADHNGNNIWPSVPTIARKVGMDERSVQRLTADMQNCGLLIEDGKGPRGTNRWRLPYNKGGDKLTPLQNVTGDKIADSLGDIPSGDIPSGDKLTPELKEPEPLNIHKDDAIEVLESVAIHALAASNKAWPTMYKRIKENDVNVVIQDHKIVISGLTRMLGEGRGRAIEAQVWQDRYGASFDRAESGTGYKVEFQQ